MKYIDPDGRTTWDQIKKEVGPAINLDFGYDYYNWSVQSYNNGDYLSGFIYSLDFTCEAIYDTLLAFGGAKVVDSVVRALPLLASTIGSLSSTSTVVLGKYSSGAFGGYTKMAEKIGAKCFQLPKGLYNALVKVGWAEKINTMWLNAVSSSGGRILLNSNPWEAMKTESAYGMEMRIMNETHTFKEILILGEKCWEAILK